MSGIGFDQFARDVSAASVADTRPVVDTDSLKGEGWKVVPYELRRFLSDICSEILLDSMRNGYNDPAARADRYARAKAAREMRAEVRGVRPR